MPYDKTKPYSCPCCGYWNGDMKYDYYKHKEPLIKDEKIRKAVRAWAEAESIPLDGTVSYNYDEYSLGWYHTSLEFSKHIQNLRDESEYTIAELCGEEEE